MSKRPSKRIPAAAPQYEWRIVRLKKSPAAMLGYVNAPDQEQAIAKAVRRNRLARAGVRPKSFPLIVPTPSHCSSGRLYACAGGKAPV